MTLNFFADLQLTDNVDDRRGVVRPDPDEGLQTRMITDRVADVIFGPRSVEVVAHRVLREE